MSGNKGGCRAGKRDPDGAEILHRQKGIFLFLRGTLRKTKCQAQSGQEKISGTAQTKQREFRAEREAGKQKFNETGRKELEGKGDGLCPM
ncbi:hypothetical protein [uncultured Allobaculum sp.]|nr:hypothetical protein [uncultured Allobaculum sp.]